MSKTHDEIFNSLYKAHGRDLLDYKKCTELLEKTLKEKTKLKAELDIDHDDSTLGKVVQGANNVIKNTDDVVEKTRKVVREIESNLNEVEASKKEAHEQSDELKKRRTILQYFKVVQKIDYWSHELEREFKTSKNDDEQCATIYANLCEISRNLATFPGVHLRRFLRETIHHWHRILREKLTRDFEGVLATLKYPFTSANFSLAQPQQPQSSVVQKLQLVTEYLLQVELPSEIMESGSTGSGIFQNFPGVCLPVQLLIKPLEKRFLYHFYGSRQTNRVDKPEWYFTQILTWIRDHCDFVSNYIQPVVDKMGLHDIDARIEFMRGLIQLCAEKMNSDLPTIQFDDFTFSHCVDEALGFDKELRETYSYPSSQPGILLVLTQAKVLLKWMAMEKKYAIEKMDAILSQPDPFEQLAYDIENLKITTCADSFITLLQTITERYECLPQPGHRLQFLDLQLDLLDDFRVRLVQLVNAEHGNIIESKVPSITNTIYYVENVLVDWGAMLNFLNLYYYKSQLDSVNSLTLTDGEATIFANTLQLYRHMKADLLHNLSEYVMLEIKSQSRDYRHNNWASNDLKVTKTKLDLKSLSLTPSACSMFETIAKRLHQLHKSLTTDLFATVWKQLAQQLDAYLFEDLILENRFNEGGALQLKYDVTRNLLPLFSQYTERPEVYFSRLVESCQLLNITKGSALLLRETLIALEGATGVEDTRGRALAEMGVVTFAPKEAVRVLNRRTDTTVKRMEVD